MDCDTVWAEVKSLFRLGLPTSIQTTLMNTSGMLLLFLTGYYFPANHEALAAVGLGIMLVNVTGRSLFIGFSFGMISLAAQANGARNYERCSHLLQRSFCLQVALSIFVSLLWLFPQPLLFFLKQTGEVSHMLKIFLPLRIPGVLTFGVFHPLLRWCGVIGQVGPLLWFGVIFIIVTPPITWALVAKGPGYYGGPLGVTIGEIISSAVCIYGILKKKLCASVWTGWSTSAITGKTEWAEFGKFTATAAMMFLFDWWGMEIQVFLAGWLAAVDEEFGAVDVAVMAIGWQVIVLCYTWPLGIGMGCTAKLGFYLGTGAPEKAKRVALITLFICPTWMALFACCLWPTRHIWIPPVLHSEKGIALMSHVLPWILLFLVLDGVQCAGQGVVRGLGTAKTGFVFGVVGQYVFAVPCSYLFAFHKQMGLVGLWYGACIGFGITATCHVVYMTCVVSYETESKLARQRSLGKIERSVGPKADSDSSPSNWKPASATDKETLVDNAAYADEEAPVEEVSKA